MGCRVIFPAGTGMYRPPLENGSMATSIEHQTLTELGARWLKRQGFSVVATELACYGNRERPDVLAFRSTCSAVLEVKISRQDFLADLKKPERSEGGLGNYRFYLCPAELIEIGDLPPRWGLLYCEGKNITSVHAPFGNLWPGPGHIKNERSPNWSMFVHPTDLQAEHRALFSIARRLAGK